MECPTCGGLGTEECLRCDGGQVCVYCGGASPFQRFPRTMRGEAGFCEYGLPGKG